MELPTVMIGKRKFTILFPDLLRPLSDSEETALRESIQKNGVQVAVVVDRENGVIDGGNRLRIASQMGIKTVPIDMRKGLSADEKRELAITLNADRRQLSAKEREQLADQRAKRVAERREAGESLRTIAEKEGVSESQVRRDLEKSSTAPPGAVGGKEGGSTAPGGAVEPKDGKVIGKDGKSRPAKMPQREREPGEDDGIFDERDAEKDRKRREANKPKPPKKDAVGAVIPACQKDIFGDPLLPDAIAWLQTTQTEVERLVERIKRKVTHYPFVLVKDLYQHLDDAIVGLQCARESLTPGIPHVVCPKCEGKGCKACRNGGHYPAWRYDELKEQESVA